MNGSDTSRSLFLNQDNQWRDFQWIGLELRGDGTLALDSLPVLQSALPDGLAAAPAPAAPAGVVVSPGGDVYVSDPRTHRVLKISGCDSTQLPILCLGGEGAAPTRFHEPRGLLYHPTRHALFVADSGNHRIQIFDPESTQLLDIWGQPGRPSEPTPGTAPGQLDTPWSLAVDAEGAIYVVDRGNQRVQKFDVRGNIVPSFWDTLRGQGALAPSDIAAVSVGNSSAIHILDAEAQTVVVCDPSGKRVRAFTAQIPQQPMGLAAREGAVYIGDNGSRRVCCFKPDGTLVGAARGFEGPVAALALDPRGDVLVHPGSPATAVCLARGGAYRENGALWGGPFRNASMRREQWHRLKATLEPLPPGAHIQIYVSEAPSVQDARTAGPEAHVGALARPMNNTLNNAIPNPFTDPRWHAIPIAPDISEVFFPGAPLDAVWVGVAFNSEGLTSPVLSQMRLDLDCQTYLGHLPAIYQKDTASRRFLERFLSLVESLFSDVEAEIDGLPALFDPEAVPEPHLSWLAQWLALPLYGAWDEAHQRHAIAHAFTSYGHRGTLEGLRQAVWENARVHVHIEEPIRQSAWWALPPDDSMAPSGGANSILGFTTALVVAQPEPAVVGTSAVLDSSFLMSLENYGAPLFEDVAHQFSVQLYRGRSYSEQTASDVRAILDREKPAHTAYHLCVVEPRMRLGFQARIGIDSIVAGPALPTRLDEAPVSSTNLVLGGEPTGRIGKRSQLGKTTRLTDKAVER